MGAVDTTLEGRRNQVDPRDLTDAEGDEFMREQSDDRSIPSVWRRRAMRRMLVVVVVAALVLSALVGFMVPEESSPAALVPAGFLLIAIFTMLCGMWWVRPFRIFRRYGRAQIAPLDEWQRAVIDAAYADAYKISGVLIPSLFLLYVAWPRFFAAPADPYGSGLGLFLPLVWFMAFLPSLVLAWRLPSLGAGD